MKIEAERNSGIWTKINKKSVERENERARVFRILNLSLLDYLDRGEQGENNQMQKIIRSSGQ